MAEERVMNLEVDHAAPFMGAGAKEMTKLTGKLKEYFFSKADEASHYSVEEPPREAGPARAADFDV